jgi:hypothetical protein
MSAFLSRLLTSCDGISPPLNFRYNNYSNIKTVIGGIVTLLLIVFITFCTIYFFEDNIYKRNPVTRFSNSYSESNEIDISDFPIIFSFVKNSKIIENPLKYISLEAYYNDMKTTEQIFQAYIETCSTSNLGNSTFHYLETNVDMNGSLCLVRSKVKYQNGNILTKSLTVLNDPMSLTKQYLNIIVNPCKNTTTAKTCAAQADIDTFLLDFNTVITTRDNYIDMSNYTDPYSSYINIHNVQTSSKLAKAVYLSTKISELFTDDGFLFENIHNSTIIQIDNIRTEVVNSIIPIQIFITGSRLSDVYYRRYVKVQEILANVGGIMNFLFTISGLLISFYSTNFAIFDLAYDIFEIHTINKDEFYRSAVNYKDLTMNSVNLNLRNMKKEDINNECFTGTFFDYIKARCRCRSLYNKKQYYSLQNLIQSRLDLKDLLCNIYATERVVRTYFKGEEERLLKSKFQLFKSKDGFYHLTTSNVFQEEISNINNNTNNLLNNTTNLNPSVNIVE